MASSGIELIRDRIRRRQYDMSSHATEEMAEDGLDIKDIEMAILTGGISRTKKDDPRGTKYVIVGTASDFLTRVGVVGRFTTTGRFLIITVYAIGS